MRWRNFFLLAVGTCMIFAFVLVEFDQISRAGQWISFEPSKADCVVAKRRTGKFQYELLVEVGWQGHDWTMGAAFTPANSPGVAEGTVVPAYTTVTGPGIVTLNNYGKLERGASEGNFQTSAWGFPVDEDGQVRYDCWGIHDAYITTNKRACR